MNPSLPVPNQLRDIRKFTDLVRYLESELEWPVEAGSFDDLTFEYQPAELGLKDEDAVKIKKIHQLRPLVTGQPWGIFFIEFEKKKLPVVVLRCILSHLVVKKRQSANKSDQAVWNPEDLLFISAYGDETSDQREIAFAHFHQQAGDLPTLRVLGWDGGDTPLKLDYVAGELKEKLHWPQNPKDQEAWRAQWRAPFRHRIGHVIRTADSLAEVLAALARGIRDRCKIKMRAESEHGALTKLYKGFQTALIHDLKPEDFADTYAQTITYGLLTAAISRTEMSQGRHGTVLYAENVTDMVPVTNPFLKEMLQTFLKVGGRKGGIDFDELGIQDVVELLRGEETDLPAILRDFGNKTRGEDPVIHFYEHFLSAYNKQLKIQRGVFYTPQPVVSYIVRSVHELLQTEFGLEDGLASTATWGEMISRSSRGNEAQTSSEKAKSEPPQVGCYELKIPDGVKSGEMFVQILDPATGTATFLVEVIDVIHRTLKAKWEKGGLSAMPALNAANVSLSAGGEGRGEGGLSQIVNRKSPIVNFSGYWNQYVPLALLPRLHGYELMMAPYAIAHMKIGLKLHETGYHFGTEERARIYLTNALEPKVTQLPQIGFDALAHEAAAVNEIKWYKRFTVVIGNPPYSNFGQLNKIPFILNLLEDYKRGLDEKKINLDDDYIKFIRFSQFTLDSTGVGIFGMITNNSFLDGVTHRCMRPFLLKSFQQIFILDLHGSTVLGEESPDGSQDENVFDIQQGVSISLQISAGSKAPSIVKHFDCFGERSAKYELLASNGVRSLSWKPIQASPPNFFFTPKDLSFETEYNQCWSLSQMFGIFSSSIKTERDRVSIHWTKEECREAVEDFRTKSDGFLKEKYELDSDSRDWKLANAKADVLANRSEKCFQLVLYRPFDVRHIWYSGRTRGFIGTPGFPTMRHMLGGKNLSLIATRLNRQASLGYFFVTRDLSDIHAVDNARDSIQIFPLFTFDDEWHLNLTSEGEPNFTAQFQKAISSQLSDNSKVKISPEDIFHYAYGVFHSPGYRSRYAEFLKIDFPRQPLTGKLELFRALARLGGELTALHLLEFETARGVHAASPSDTPKRIESSDASPDSTSKRPEVRAPLRYAKLTEYLGSRSPEVEKISWSKNTVWLDKAQTTGFQGVREDVWNFHIGGYQVCEKWLKDRKGRTLSAADREHYQKIIVALSETIQLMKEIDAVIEKHGGWPLT